MDIPLLETLHQTPDIVIYRVDGRPYPLLCTVKRVAGEARRPTEVKLGSSATAVADFGDFLSQLGWLKQNGGNPALCLPGRRPEMSPAANAQRIAALLERACVFGIQDRGPAINPPRDSFLTDATNQSVRSILQHLEANPDNNLQIRPLHYRAGFGALVGENTPLMAANLPWPIVGQIKGIEAGKFYWQPEPGEPRVPPAPLMNPEDNRDRKYPHLRRIFAHHDLCPYSHYRLFQYLLGCFHTSYLNQPVPLLVIDSWEQAMGKTEIAEAIANMLHGDRVPCISPGRRSDAATDQLTSHYGGTKYYTAVLDNLDGTLDWNHDWLATLLTQRSGGCRLRYDRTNTAFCARAAILTLIYGRATLHEDMISRTWRVQVRGTVAKWEKKPPPFYSKDYALEHRDELISECYWAVKRGLEKNPPNPAERHRARAFAAAGHAGYLEVFGEAPKVPDAHRLMLTTEALQLLKVEKAPFQREPVATRIISPCEELYARFEGGEALGLTVKGGKVGQTTP